MTTEPQYFKVLAERALEKLSRAPGTLDSCDLGQLDILGQGDEARAAKAAALAPAVTPVVEPVSVAPEHGPAWYGVVETALMGHKAAITKIVAFITAANAKNAERNTRLDALEAKVAALEAQTLTYGGIWGDGEAHAKNTLCTRSGSLWISERDTHAQPGTPDSGWRLIVKKGSLPDDHH